MGMPRWNMTDERIKNVRSLLRKQYTLSYIHAKLYQNQVSYNVFSTKINEAGIDWKAEHDIALNGLKASLFKTISETLEPKDRVTEGMKYLARYEKLETTDTDTGPSLGSLVDKAIGELRD